MSGLRDRVRTRVDQRVFIQMVDRVESPLWAWPGVQVQVWLSVGEQVWFRACSQMKVEINDLQQDGGSG